MLLSYFLNENWNSPELQKQIQLLREQAAKDVNNNLPDAVLIPETQDEIIEGEIFKEEINEEEENEKEKK